LKVPNPDDIDSKDVAGRINPNKDSNPYDVNGKDVLARINAEQRAKPQ
jgi:hypothetical protein